MSVRDILDRAVLNTNEHGDNVSATMRIADWRELNAAVELLELNYAKAKVLTAEMAETFEEVIREWIPNSPQKALILARCRTVRALDEGLIERP